ncbi:MAG: DNA-processing protein DprA [Euryarchaeota archaeon]|nr:DNA-processing protein DprA [Euryarchaeota archaeon]
MKIREVKLSELLGRPLNDVEKKYAPEVVYVSGCIKIPLPGPRVAIVGTRNPSSEGLSIATAIARKLTERGVIVVSGLARGIDTVAHKTAIESGGKTIAVLGTPLNKFYPAENRTLQELIMREHLAVSQYPIGHVTKPKDFVFRNRTMALISDASIIVEAGKTSGVVSQGWETLRLGRPLFLWKQLLNKSLDWPEKMIKYGAVKLNSLEELDYVIDSLFPPVDGVISISEVEVP